MLPTSSPASIGTVLQHPDNPIMMTSLQNLDCDDERDTATDNPPPGKRARFRSCVGCVLRDARCDVSGGYGFFVCGFHLRANRVELSDLTVDHRLRFRLRVPPVATCACHERRITVRARWHRYRRGL